MGKPSREIKVLMLVTLHAEPNWTAIEFSDRIQGPALKGYIDGRDDEVVCPWDPSQLFDDLAWTLQDEFPKDKGNPYYVKSVKQAIAE